MQAGIEEVLVRRAIYFRCDNTATTLRFGTWHHTGGLDNTGQFGLHFNGAILIQIPVKPIIIVADGTEKADHQTTGAAYLKDVRAEFVVLPQRAVIFFVHTHGVLHGEGFALVIHRRNIKIMNRAETIAA